MNVCLPVLEKHYDRRTEGGEDRAAPSIPRRPLTAVPRRCEFFASWTKSQAVPSYWTDTPLGVPRVVRCTWEIKIETEATTRRELGVGPHALMGSSSGRHLSVLSL